MVRSLIYIVAVCVMYVAVESVELYSDKYDGIDLHAILADDTRREQYYSCFMDTGPCVTEDASYFKSNFPESIVTKCSRCTEKQKQMFDVLVEWYLANQEEKWNALIAKFLEDAKKLNIASA